MYISDQSTGSVPKTDNRKLIIEQLNKELHNSKMESEEFKKKLNASKARVRVLESENYCVKSKLTSQTERFAHTEELIKMLQVLLMKIIFNLFFKMLKL